MIVVSLGGSIVAPDGIDAEYVRAFRSRIVDYLDQSDDKIILIVGGGGPARRYQSALRAILGAVGTTKTEGVAGAASSAAGAFAPGATRAEGGTAPTAPPTPPTPDALDWIGIMATRLNAELVRHVMAPYCQDPVVYDPTGSIEFTGRVLVGAGWKPGFSTDFDAVLLAERFGAGTVVNLSNIAKVYTADPRQNPDARPLDHVSWADFRLIVGNDWAPGINVPFDPVATRRAAELGLRVIAAAGANLDTVSAILRGQPFEGTEIGPE